MAGLWVFVPLDNRRGDGWHWLPALDVARSACGLIGFDRREWPRQRQVPRSEQGARCPRCVQQWDAAHGKAPE